MTRRFSNIAETVATTTQCAAMIFVHLDSTKTNNKQGGTQGFWEAFYSDLAKDQFCLHVKFLWKCSNNLIDWLENE